MVVQVSLYWILIILDYTFSYTSCKNPIPEVGVVAIQHFFCFLLLYFVRTRSNVFAPELLGG